MIATQFSLSPVVLTSLDMSSMQQGIIPSGDCDCACSEASLGIPFNRLSAMCVDNVPYVRSSDLRIPFLEPDYWLVFTPLSEGGVIVANQTALGVLDFFESPHCPDDIIAAFPDLLPLEIRRTLAILINLRFLRREVEDEKPRFPESRWLTAWVHITNRCSLRCSYCYLYKSPQELSLDIGKRALETIFRTAEKHQLEGVKIKYAGGEPALGFHRIIELHQHAGTLRRGSPVALDEVVLSNGVGITDAMIDTLKDNSIRLMISLDGVGEYHDAQRVFADGSGSFSIVAKTIERLLQRGLVPHVSITISGKNIDGVAETVAYVLERDLPFSLNFYRENDRSTTFQDLCFSDQRMIEGLRRAFQVIEKNLPKRSLLGSVVDRAQFFTPHQHTCGAGNNYLVIDTNGKIAKCHMDIEKATTDIYADDPLQFIRADRIGIQNLPVDEKEGCRDCTWKYWCAGGCAVATFRATGRYDVKSPNCNIYKAIYPEALKLEGLRLLKYYGETPSNRRVGS